RDNPKITIEEYIRLEEEKLVRKVKCITGKLLSMVRSGSLNNNEIKFRISFDESDDEDYTVVFDKTSISYKINDLKTDLENDNEKVNIPLFSLPDPLVNTYTVYPLFSIRDDRVNKLVQYGVLDKHQYGVSSLDMDFPPRDQRHLYLRYEGLQYTDADIVDFEMRLAKIYRRKVHRVQVFDFGGLQDLMAEGLRGPLVHELILEFFSTFRFREGVLDLDTVGALQFQLGRVRRRRFECSLDRDLVYGGFLGTPPSFTLIMDPMLRLCHTLIACSIAGRSQAPEKGPKRQQVAAAGNPKATEDAPVADEGALAIPAPV
nr:hypothetical protein [Tanacetum cinerariifolium]